MLKFLTDENFNGHILNGLKRLRPDVDWLRVQDSGLFGADDPRVLEEAALLSRVLLTHDAATIPDFAYERIGDSMPMPGVLVVRRSLSVSEAIAEIILILDLAGDEDVYGQVYCLPL